MVTHDAPAAAIGAVFPNVRLFRPLSRTMQAFDAMFEHHSPDAWIFGHVPIPNSTFPRSLRP